MRNGRPLADFLRDFALYYEKANSIRPLVLPKFLAFKLYILGVSSIPAVIVGQGRWLFLRQENDKVNELRYFLGTNPFNETNLRQWLRMLTERRRWLESRGIAYWLIVPPNKSTIYPENMPSAYPRGRTTRMDQFAEFLRERAPDFPLVDLRPVLRAGKKARLVYWPTDTHWNDFGRDLAYREIIRRLAERFPSLETVPADAFEVQPCKTPAHDLEDLLLLRWDPPGPLFQLVPRPRFPGFPVLEPLGSDAAGVFAFRSRAGVIPLALFIHDSFGDTLKPLLSTHFRKSKWILDRRHSFPAAWIDRMRPNLVIDEVVERYLDEDPWTNPSGLGDTP